MTTHDCGRGYQLVAPEHGVVASTEVAEPGPDQVLMRVIANGVCASDLATWSAGPTAGPLELGHEPVGTVVATGAGVDLAAGTFITGRITPSYASHVLADIRDVVAVPVGLDPQLAIGEPLGCVAEGFRRTPFHLADRVAVIGLGFMGLLMVQFVRWAATAAIIAVDVRDDAQASALRHGADMAYHPASLPAETVNSGFDVVVEATGSQAGLDLATALVRPHGVISILGYHQATRSVDMAAWNWKAIDVVNAHVRDRDLLRESTRRGLELVAANKIDLSGLITHRFTLDRVDDAFATLRAKPPGFVKAMITIE